MSEQIIAGRYRLDEQVGRGATGSVWSGWDTFLQRRVAIKIVQLEGAKDPQMGERFRREGIAIAGIHDRGIVQIYDAAVDDEYGWLVMDLLSGPNLVQLVESSGPLHYSVALPLLAKVARGLHAAHLRGITHRDVKPANIVLNAPDIDLYAHPEQGYPVLVDFGIARIVDESASQLTRPATAIGTAAYMSPEQAKGQQVFASADIYSLGCVAYYLLTGRPPFVADSSVAVAHSQAFDTPKPLRELSEDIPLALDIFIGAMMAKDPSMRPDAAEVAEELMKICEDPSRKPYWEVDPYAQTASQTRVMDSVEPSSISTRSRQLSKSRLIERIIFAILTIVLIAALAWTWSRPDTPTAAPTVTMTHTATAMPSREELSTHSPVQINDSYAEQTWNEVIPYIDQTSADDDENVLSESSAEPTVHEPTPSVSSDLPSSASSHRETDA